MSERDLATMLGDHLDHEPPVGVTSADAIRTARRGGPRRLAGAGIAAVAVLGASLGIEPRHGTLAAAPGALGSSVAVDGLIFGGVPVSVDESGEVTVATALVG